MKNTLIIKKCLKCGAVIKIINDCKCDGCGINCCNEKMTTLIPNSVDANIEKHVPSYKIVEDEIFITVNHVMEKEHFIEWIAMEKDGIYNEVQLYPEQNSECRFKYIPGAKIYAYCNKHGLWMAVVE